MRSETFTFTYIIALIFLVSCSGSKDIGASSKNTPKNIKEARSSVLLFTPKNIKKSIEKYLNILNSNPNDTNALAGLSESYAFLGYYNQEIKVDYESEYNLAYKYILKALKNDKNNPNVKRALAYNYLFLSREKEARTISREILDTDPKNIEALYIYWASKGKNPDDSKIQKVISEKSNFMLARVEYIKSLFYKRRYTSASEEAVKALNVYQSPYLHTLLGTIYRTKKAVDDSIVEYNEALNIDSKFALALMNKGISQYYRGNTGKSIDNLEKAISINPRLADSYYYLGGNYQRNGKRIEAIENYRKFISMTAGQNQYSFLTKRANENLLRISN